MSGSLQSKLPDLVAAELGKPEVAVRSPRDSKRLTSKGINRASRDCKFRDSPARRDLRDLIADVFSEPDCTVRPLCDSTVGIALRSRQHKLGDAADRSDSPYLAACGKPEVAVWTRSDIKEVAPKRDCKLGDVAARGDSPYVIVLGEPDVAVWTRSDANGITPWGRYDKLGDVAARGNSPYLVPHTLGKPDVAVWTRRDSRR